MLDMTVGQPRTHLIKYAIPVLLGNWLQLAYNAIDSIIAGQFIGKEALAAEGIAAPVMNLVILAISGLCIGAGVLMSEFFGAKNYEGLRKSLGTILSMGAIVSVILACLCIVVTPWILELVQVPAQILDITGIYIRITFIGMPFTYFYNALAAGLKSVGDSKTPLKFLMFSSILNAVLDLVFLGIFKYGIVCSAVTTVVAEAVSAILAAGYMKYKQGQLFPGREEFLPDMNILRKVINYGGPTAIQQAIQPIGKLLIQGQVNALGVTTIAAFNAVTRVDDFACIPEQGISAAISTYIAQNRGAKRYDRIKNGFKAGLLLETCYWVIIGTIALTLRAPIISLFVKENDAAAVVEVGSQYLLLMALFYLWPAMTNGFQGFYRGMGKMYTTILGTTIQITLRTIFTYILAPSLGIVGIAYACAIGWSAMLLFEIPYYFITCKNFDKTV